MRFSTAAAALLVGSGAGRAAPATEPPAPPSAAEPAPASAEPPAPEASAPPPAAPEAEAPPLLAAGTWRKDGRIREIGRMVRVIDTAQRRGELAERARAFGACGPDEDAERRIYATAEGKVVRYVRQVGGADASLTVEQYYDAEGRLRYVFIHGGARTGAVLEHRLWLDAEGRRLWEEQHLRGRYPFPRTWPSSDLTLRAPDASALRCNSP